VQQTLHIHVVGSLASPVSQQTRAEEDQYEIVKLLAVISDGINEFSIPFVLREGLNGLVRKTQTLHTSFISLERKGFSMIGGSVPA